MEERNSQAVLIPVFVIGMIILLTLGASVFRDAVAWKERGCQHPFTMAIARGEPRWDEYCPADQG